MKSFEITKKTGIFHEDGSDVIRLEGENSKGEEVYNYFPLASWSDAKQLVISAEKIFRLRF